jgi:hypothetical protein
MLRKKAGKQRRKAHAADTRARADTHTHCASIKGWADAADTGCTFDLRPWQAARGRARIASSTKRTVGDAPVLIQELDDT